MDRLDFRYQREVVKEKEEATALTSELDDALKRLELKIRKQRSDNQ